MSIRAQRIATIAALTCILLYAGLLRFDALFKSYGPYERPPWLAALQPVVGTAAAALTPDWPRRRDSEPYVGGDPVNYLKFAREMRSFYAAHVREPGFPGATRVALMLTGNEDVSVSLASIAFALLTLVATFALGAALGSPAAGLAAALALGIDRSAVHWSVGGWRDEMFAFFAVMSAWAWLRLSQHATHSRAIVAGLVSGGAILTRITSISLLVPAAVFLLARRDPTRRAPPKQVGIAAAIAIAMAAPFLINCYIATGDPFYAINNHTDFYLKREGTADPAPISAFRYAIEKFQLRPIAAADTVATGIFLYPFANKWVGLDAWLSGLGSVLAVLAVAGLVAWMWHPDGRLMLVMLLCALVPFSVTWTVLGGAEWRLTLFVYSFLLLAAFWVVAALARTRLTWLRPPAGILRPAAVTAGLAVVFVVWTYAVPFAIAREALVAGAPATITAARRNEWLLDDGWSRPVVTGNVVSRFATERVATARIPLPEVRPYAMMLRLHPVNAAGVPEQTVDVALNDVPLATLRLQWNAERIGEYRLTIPADRVRQGMNRLAFRSASLVTVGSGSESFPELPSDLPVGFRLWYILLVPQ